MNKLRKLLLPNGYVMKTFKSIFLVVCGHYSNTKKFQGCKNKSGPKQLISNYVKSKREKSRTADKKNSSS